MASKPIEFLLVNLFIVTFILVGAGLLWLFGWLMWSLDLPPDDHPAIAGVGAILSLIGTYFIMKKLHAMIERRL